MTRTRWIAASSFLFACGGGSDATGEGTDGSTSSGSTAVTEPTSSTTSTTASTATSAETTSADSEATTAMGGTGGGFELDVHTELVDGALALRCNLPSALALCLELDGAPCEDADGDGLTDLWEEIVLDRLRPMRRLDEAEMLVGDAEAVLGDVGRVFPVADHVRVFVMLGYSSDYGSCGLTAHNGDSERVALDLVAWPDGGQGGVRVNEAYTAAHEFTANDHSQRFGPDALGDLVFDADPEHAEPRWVVFPSADKHATYVSVAVCEAISVVPCIDEDCGPEGVDDPAAFDRLPPFVNAGEPTSMLVTALDELGFVGDDAWAEQDFCGGLGGSGCSAPVREKLTMDPFE